MRSLIIPAIAALSLAACDPVTEVASPDAETPPVELAEAGPAEDASAPPTDGTIAERKTATIDWNAARADFAARDFADDAMAQVASSGSPAVPILLPDEPVGIASAGADDALQFRPLADGYFAVKKGDVYDVVINGTDRLIARSDGGTATDSPLKYEETMTGALVSFSRYGASNLVEFMCQDREAVLDGSCDNEADDLAELEKLLIAGTR